MKKILLLGSGELGKEFVIAAKRAGQYVIACDRYNDAPAMQVADEREVFSMLDGAVLDRVVEKHNPDIIVPEIEAILYYFGILGREQMSLADISERRGVTQETMMESIDINIRKLAVTPEWQEIKKL